VEREKLKSSLAISIATSLLPTHTFPSILTVGQSLRSSPFSFRCQSQRPRDLLLEKSHRTRAKSRTRPTFRVSPPCKSSPPMQPSASDHRMRWAESRVGHRPHHGRLRLASLQKFGRASPSAPTMTCSDKPFPRLYACFTRERPTAAAAGGWQPQGQNNLRRRFAPAALRLRLRLRPNAWKEKGRTKAGELSPTSSSSPPPHQIAAPPIHQTTVIMTIVGGRTVLSQHPTSPVITNALLSVRRSPPPAVSLGVSCQV